MVIKAFTLFSFAISSVLLFASCKQETFDPYHSESGLVANGDYRASSVQYSKSLRMFTQAGEITDQHVISTYISIHPNLLQLAFGPDTASSLQIIASQSHIVYLNLTPYIASVANRLFDMRQKDTSDAGGTNPGQNVDFLYTIEQSYDTLMHQMLEMNQSHTRIERTAFDSYSKLRSYHLVGSLNNGELTLPYTFLATRFKADNFLFAEKSNLQPKIATGDTVLVHEGSVVFRKR